MEVLPIIIGIIALIILFKEDSSAMNDEQLKQCQQLKGETQVEKAKAKKSVYSSISNLANMLKV